MVKTWTLVTGSENMLLQSAKVFTLKEHFGNLLLYRVLAPLFKHFSNLLLSLNKPEIVAYLLNQIYVLILYDT